MSRSRKNNIRSFRFSDEVLAVLERQEGKTLNEKFENLILKCCFEGQIIEKHIAELKAERQKMFDDLWSFRKRIAEFDLLLKDIKSAKFSLGIVCRRAEAIAVEDVTQISPEPSGT